MPDSLGPKYVRRDPGNVYLTFPVFWSLEPVSHFIFPSYKQQHFTGKSGLPQDSPPQLPSLTPELTLVVVTIIQGETPTLLVTEWSEKIVGIFCVFCSDIPQVRGRACVGWLAGYSDWFIIIMILNIIYQHSPLLTVSPWAMARSRCPPLSRPLTCVSPGPAHCHVKWVHSLHSSGGDFDAHYTRGWIIFHNLVTFNHSCHDAIVDIKSAATHLQNLYLSTSWSSQFKMFWTKIKED